jgi:hypothetical protein
MSYLAAFPNIFCDGPIRVAHETQFFKKLQCGVQLINVTCKWLSPIFASTSTPFQGGACLDWGCKKLHCFRTLGTSGPFYKLTRGVTHCGLAIYIKKYLKAKEELWKLKYSTMQKYNLQKIL